MLFLVFIVGIWIECWKCNEIIWGPYMSEYLLNNDNEWIRNEYVAQSIDYPNHVRIDYEGLIYTDTNTTGYGNIQLMFNAIHDPDGKGLGDGEYCSIVYRIDSPNGSGGNSDDGWIFVKNYTQSDLEEISMQNTSIILPNEIWDRDRFSIGILNTGEDNGCWFCNEHDWCYFSLLALYGELLEPPISTSVTPMNENTTNLTTTKTIFTTNARTTTNNESITITNNNNDNDNDKMKSLQIAIPWYIWVLFGTIVIVICALIIIYSILKHNQRKTPSDSNSDSIKKETHTPPAIPIGSRSPTLNSCKPDLSITNANLDSLALSMNHISSSTDLTNNNSNDDNNKPIYNHNSYMTPKGGVNIPDFGEDTYQIKAMELVSYFTDVNKSVNNSETNLEGTQTISSKNVTSTPQ